ncbi:MAG: hypothetical protein FWE33_07745 [Defluviitaleaceae bacterium]|nr:hypothetical protein [Defluviitaleaceae bacterium]
MYCHKHLVALAMTVALSASVIARDVPTIMWVANPEAIQPTRHQVA